MPVKRTKYRVGPFTTEKIEVDANSSAPEAVEAIKAGLKACTPRGRLAIWRPHSERIGVATGLLDEAEALLDARGALNTRPMMDRFDLLLEQAKRMIEQSEFEEKFLPLAVLGSSRKRQLAAFGAVKDEERHQEWGRWKEEAEAIRKRCGNRQHSIRALAGFVKRNLNLLDSIETIRKKI